MNHVEEYKSALQDFAEDLNDLMADMEDFRDEMQDTLDADASPDLRTMIEKMDAVLGHLSKAADMLDEDA